MQVEVASLPQRALSLLLQSAEMWRKTGQPLLPTRIPRLYLPPFHSSLGNGPQYFRAGLDLKPSLHEHRDVRASLRTRLPSPSESRLRRQILRIRRH